MIDIKFTADGDIDFTGGDISYGESTKQHQRDLILAQKGHFKHAPEAGVGAINFLHDETPEQFLRAVRKEFARDGMKVNRLAFAGGELKMNAEYK